MGIFKHLAGRDYPPLELGLAVTVLPMTLRHACRWRQRLGWLWHHVHRSMGHVQVAQAGLRVTIKGAWPPCDLIWKTNGNEIHVVTSAVLSPLSSSTSDDDDGDGDGTTMAMTMAMTMGRTQGPTIDLPTDLPTHFLACFLACLLVCRMTMVNELQAVCKVCKP